MRKLIIKKASIKNNIKIVKERSGSAAIYAVLSGNGCGAGTAQLAQVLSAEGITRFAVSEVEEAEALREAGFVEEEILMLRATTDREELERLVDLNVVCTISSVDTGLALNSLAEHRSTVAEAHIQVDTGLGFGGFLVSEPEKVLLAYRSLPKVALSGIYTQLHAVSKKDPETAAQLEMDWTVLTNCGTIPTDIYGIGGIPHLMLIGPDGTILERGFHGLEGIEAAVAKHIN